MWVATAEILATPPHPSVCSAFLLSPLRSMPEHLFSLSPVNHYLAPPSPSPLSHQRFPPNPQGIFTEPECKGERAPGGNVPVWWNLRSHPKEKHTHTRALLQANRQTETCSPQIPFFFFSNAQTHTEYVFHLRTRNIPPDAE